MKLWNKLFGYPKRDPKHITILKGMTNSVLNLHTKEPYGIGDDFAFGVHIGYLIDLKEKYDIMKGDWLFIRGIKYYITEIKGTRLYTKTARRVDNEITDSLDKVESPMDYFKWTHIPEVKYDPS
ncbi:MAG: hypothetical protein HRU21_09245 [Pseudomonadales bacterium]|nr:hypothetical protein [Pseudomonadales bacterium]